jgi:predicted  nucleic acid-binding Zn-ribbon protein
MELVSVVSSRLENVREEPEITGILGALDDHRYAEAAGLIDKLLSDGTRLARWADPEIALLDAELERVTADLADLETENAEFETLRSRFETDKTISNERRASTQPRR